MIINALFNSSKFLVSVYIIFQNLLISAFILLWMIMILTKITAAINEVALICEKVRGPYFLAVIFVVTK